MLLNTGISMPKHTFGVDCQKILHLIDIYKIHGAWYGDLEAAEYCMCSKVELGHVCRIRT